MEQEFERLLKSSSVSLQLIKHAHDTLVTANIQETFPEVAIAEHLISTITERLSSTIADIRSVENVAKRKEEQVLKCIRKMNRLIKTQKKIISDYSSSRKPACSDASCFVDQNCFKNDSSCDESAGSTTESSVADVKSVCPHCLLLEERVQSFEAQNRELQAQIHRSDCLLKAQQIILGSCYSKESLFRSARKFTRQMKDVEIQTDDVTTEKEHEFDITYDDDSIANSLESFVMSEHEEDSSVLLGSELVRKDRIFCGIDASEIPCHSHTAYLKSIGVNENNSDTEYEEGSHSPHLTESFSTEGINTSLSDHYLDDGDMGTSFELIQSCYDTLFHLNT